MKITRIETKPLRLPYRTVFHWSKGTIEAAEVILVSVYTDEGITGYGESMNSAGAASVTALLQEAAKLCIGQDPLHLSRLLSECYAHLFAARGTCSAPRFGALTLAGLDLALWDIAGKASNRPVHELLGGRVRDHILYFGFPQGDTADRIAEDAKQWVDRGCEVIYVKIGRGEAIDLELARRVRSVIGSSRLRLDANEAWDALTARRMIQALSEHQIEFIEQPTRSDSIFALAQLRKTSPIAIAADQLVFTPEDVYAVCLHEAADLIVLGLHETGGIMRLIKGAAIAEVAGLNVCLHGVYETGITTCASNQVGALLTNLDDGNQYMNHLLVEDIVASPNLSLHQGKLPIFAGPGLGFELDWDAIGRAAETYRRHHRL